MKKGYTEEEKVERAIDIFCMTTTVGMMMLLCLGELVVDRISTAIDNKIAQKKKKDTSVSEDQNLEDLKNKEAIEKAIEENYTYQK